MNLKNKKIVVLGGSSGIGFAIAKQALLEGAEEITASEISFGMFSDTSVETAIAALYLMKNTYSTGNTLFVDGGLTFR